MRGQVMVRERTVGDWGVQILERETSRAVPDNIELNLGFVV